GPFTACSQNVTHAIGVGIYLTSTVAYWFEFRVHVSEQRLLAVNAPPCGGAAVHCHLFLRLHWREGLVQVIDVAHLRLARIGFAHSLRVGYRRPQLPPDGVRFLEQTNRIANGLGHLRLAVEAHDPPRWREQCLRLRKVRRVLRGEPGVPLPGNLAR